MSHLQTAECAVFLRVTVITIFRSHLRSDGCAVVAGTVIDIICHLPEKMVRIAYVADEACVVEQTAHIVVAKLRCFGCYATVIIKRDKTPLICTIGIFRACFHILICECVIIQTTGISACLLFAAQIIASLSTVYHPDVVGIIGRFLKNHITTVIIFIFSVPPIIYNRSSVNIYPFVSVSCGKITSLCRVHDRSLEGVAICPVVLR